MTHRLFVPDTPEDLAAETARYQRQRSLLDNVLSEAKSLNRKLSQEDRARLDQYLDSVRDVERQLDRNQQWLDQPKPEIDASQLQFEFKNRSEFLEVMYDLMLLALRTDATRVITLMSGVEVDSYQWQELGVNDTYHGIQHHGRDKGSLEKLAKVDRREADLLADFLKGLHGIDEENGSLLDRTLVLYGSGMNNRTGLEDGGGNHSTRKLPMLLAGGAASASSRDSTSSTKTTPPLSAVSTSPCSRPWASSSKVSSTEPAD